MARVNLVATQKVLQDLMAMTGMSYTDLSHLRQEFAYALANNRAGKG